MDLTGTEVVHLYKYMRLFFPKSIELLYDAGSAIKALREHIKEEQLEGMVRWTCEEDVDVDLDRDQRKAASAALREAVSNGHVQASESDVIRPLLEKLESV